MNGQSADLGDIWSIKRQMMGKQREVNQMLEPVGTPGLGAEVYLCLGATEFFEQILGGNEGQGTLGRCSPRGHRSRTRPSNRWTKHSGNYPSHWCAQEMRLHGAALPCPPHMAAALGTRHPLCSCCPCPFPSHQVEGHARGMPGISPGASQALMVTCSRVGRGQALGWGRMGQAGDQNSREH